MMGVFSVVATPVPKLGLQGEQVGVPPDARNFSKAGNQILDSYSKQAATSKAVPIAGTALALPTQTSPRTENQQRLYVEVLSDNALQRGHSVHTALVDDGTVASFQGAWAPSLKTKPALLRSNPKIPSSPRTHSPGGSALIYCSCPDDRAGPTEM